MISDNLVYLTRYQLCVQMKILRCFLVVLLFQTAVSCVEKSEDIFIEAESMDSLGGLGY